MKKSVLLINPPSSFLIDERVFTPTGILYVASELESRNYDVKILDLSRKNNEGVEEFKETFVNKIKECAEDYDIIGVSSTSPQYKYALKILREIRRANPNAVTILGGAHATLVSALRTKMIKQYGNDENLEKKLNDFDPNFKSVAEFDYVVEGGASGIFQAINGCDSKWIKSEQVSGSIPKMARHLINMDSYSYKLTNPKTGEVVKATNVMSQWGCPFSCNFCSGRNHPFYRTVVQNPVDETIAELDFLNEQYGIKGFMFFDDELNINPKRFTELLIKLKEKHEEKGYVYRGFVKSELIINKTPNLLQEMANAGFVEVCTGVESGSDRILKDVIKKNTNSSINYNVVQLAKEAGVNFKTFAMIGHPTETEEDVAKTLEWLIKANPTSFDITVLQPYPGSPIYDNAIKDEVTGIFYLPKNDTDLSFDKASLYFDKPDFGKEETVSFYKGIPGKYVSNVWTRELSREKIAELRDIIEEIAKEKK